MCYCAQHFWCGWWESNSGFHACRQSTLPTESLPSQPPFTLWLILEIIRFLNLNLKANLRIFLVCDFSAFGGLNEKWPLKAPVFEYLVPTSWHCFERFRRWSLAEGSMSLKLGLESLKPCPISSYLYLLYDGYRRQKLSTPCSRCYVGHLLVCLPAMIHSGSSSISCLGHGILSQWRSNSCSALRIYYQIQGYKHYPYILFRALLF